jgi:Fur family ferric uptake transcriptional regulator
MIELADELVDPIRNAIQEKYGFVAAVDHLALFGICAYCRGQERGG